MSSYSNSTRSLVEELLKQKKVSFRQQRQIQQAMAVGAALPSQAPAPPQQNSQSSPKERFSFFCLKIFYAVKIDLVRRVSQ